MARGQVLLVGQDAGVEADDDADVLAETLVPLGGKLGSHTGGTENGELAITFFFLIVFFCDGVFSFITISLLSTATYVK